MPDLSPVQLIIALVIALVVLGPKRLPEVGRSLGKGIREFKDSVSGHDRDDDEDVQRRAGIEPPAPVAYQPPPASPAERATQRD